jgi:hypothetical protein
MRKLATILAALCGPGAAALAPLAAAAADPQVVLVDPEFPDGDAIVIPAGSALSVSFPPDPDYNARFSGRLTLTGAYEVKGYGEDAWVTLRPDPKSLATLPQWRERWEGPLQELYVANGWAFAEAVLPKDELEKLKDESYSVRGQATVVVDDYETSVECDHAHYSARFVSVVNFAVDLADKAGEEEEAGC